jgi:hypothetical protein
VTAEPETIATSPALDVLDSLMRLGPCTERELVEDTGRERREVERACIELEARGEAEVCPEKKQGTTGRPARQWRAVVPGLPARKIPGLEEAIRALPAPEPEPEPTPAPTSVTAPATDLELTLIDRVLDEAQILPGWPRVARLGALAEWVGGRR